MKTRLELNADEQTIMKYYLVNCPASGDLLQSGTAATIEEAELTVAQLRNKLGTRTVAIDLVDSSDAQLELLALCIEKTGWHGATSAPVDRRLRYGALMKLADKIGAAIGRRIFTPNV